MTRVAWFALVVAAAPCAAAQSDHFPIFRLHGFGDVELHTSSDNQREGLDLAEIDLYPTAQFSDRWSALAEILTRRDLRKKSGSAPDTGRTVVAELDLERLFVTYEPTDFIRIEAGETHTGIVQWNEREHRSRLLQTPIDVPAIARPPQDDGAWPLRFVGVWISGRSQGPLGFRYAIALGNGSGKTRDSIPILSRDRSPAVLLSFSVEPARFRGLALGVAAYAQRIPTDEPMRERDVTFSVNYVNRGTEIRSEWARMHHFASESNRHFRSTGSYLLLSQRLPGRLSPLRPYVLIDRLDVAKGEAYLRDTPGENAFAAGVRWDLTHRFSVKGEYRRQRSPVVDREQIYGLQLGVAF
jgi:hypothetical protein